MAAKLDVKIFVPGCMQSESSRVATYRVLSEVCEGPEEVDREVLVGSNTEHTIWVLTVSVGHVLFFLVICNRVQ